MNTKHILLAAIVSIISACTTQELSFVDDDGTMVFHACGGDTPPSKTELQSDGLIKWSPGDKIQVYYDDYRYGLISGEFTSTNTSVTYAADFKGALPGYVETTSSSWPRVFWAVYPSKAACSFHGAITVELPSEQIGKADSFADDLFISIARSSDRNLTFYNVCGGIKFSLVHEGIRKVSFRGNRDEILAGKTSITMDEFGTPCFFESSIEGDLTVGNHPFEEGEDSEPERVLTLYGPDGKDFKPGKWYYFVSFPADLSEGYTMEMYDAEDRMVSSISSQDPVEIKRSVWGVLRDADDSATPLTLEAIEDGVITVSRGYNSIHYSVNDNWTTRLNGDEFKISVKRGDIIKFEGYNPSASLHIDCSSDCYVYGNILSILDGGYSTTTSLSGKLTGLFSGNTHLLNHPDKKILLPATELRADGCYARMFSGCTSLTKAPELPATDLTKNCYENMFYGCSSLISAPELPATFVREDCYRSMFEGCTSLSSAPDLPSTYVKDGCYAYMFRGCSSLTAAPSLLASKLKECCYEGMFYGCSSLRTAPELPATTLAGYCYKKMFYGCSSLTTPPELPATTLADNCYVEMFYGCSSLTTAPELPATTLAEYCYRSMFYGCSSLTTAPELPATTLAKYCYLDMFKGCSSLTTALVLPATTLAYCCYENMFYDCSSLTTAPELPATKLATYCYLGLFHGCSSLTTAPELPATTLAYSCYNSMFCGCSSLTTAPELPATTLAETCYQGMFEGCSSLTTAPALPATTLAKYCYVRMFDGCLSLTTAPELPATTLADGCYVGMFMYCGSLKHIKCFAENGIGGGSTTDWVKDVASKGVFVRSPNAHSWSIGLSGIPDGWTVEVEDNDDTTEIIDSGGLDDDNDDVNVGAIITKNGAIGIVAHIFEDSRVLLMSVEEIQKKPWDESNDWCSSYGSSWRMPTIDELTLIHNNFEKLNTILSSNGYPTLSSDNRCYWSSTVNPNNSDYYYRERLHDGEIFRNTGNDERKASTANFTRAVRIIPAE